MLLVPLLKGWVEEGIIELILCHSCPCRQGGKAEQLFGFRGEGLEEQIICWTYLIILLPLMTVLEREKKVDSSNTSPTHVDGEGRKGIIELL